MRTVIAGCAAAWSLPALAPLWPGLRCTLRIPGRIHEEAVACLTFDDGPHPQGTPAVMEALDLANAKATFFCVGEQVRREPSLAAELVGAGHAVEVHGDRHRNQLRLSPVGVADDLRRGAEAIAEATGRWPGYHRPPYGIFSAGSLAATRRLGFAPLLWSRWGRDWRRDATPEEIAQLVSADVKAGDILLLHDSDAYSAPGSWRATAAALPMILDSLARQQLAPATLPSPAKASISG